MNIFSSIVHFLILSFVFIFCMTSKLLINSIKNRNNLTTQASIPCKKCYFFALNYPYLMCAVNPTIVLTKEAIKCSDFHVVKYKNLENKG